MTVILVLARNRLLSENTVMRLNIGFSNFSDDAFADHAAAIVVALTGNPNFPSPTPTLAAVSSAIANLRAAVAKPDGPAHAQAIAAARAELNALLQQLGQNLASTPGATDAGLATTGFHLPKRPVHSTAPPTAPGNVCLNHGQNQGEVVPRCAPSDGARSYDIEWTLDPNAGPWTDAGSFPSTRGMLLSCLARGKDIWVRIRALGTNGISAWSDPATIMVT